MVDFSQLRYKYSQSLELTAFKRYQHREIFSQKSVRPDVPLP